MALPLRRSQPQVGMPQRSSEPVRSLTGIATAPGPVSVGLAPPYQAGTAADEVDDSSRTENGRHWWEALGHLYDTRDEPLRDVLVHHPAVGPFLEETAYRIRDYFPVESRLLIRYVHDPEDGSTGWYVFIETALSVEDAVDRLDRFDHDWWLDAKGSVTPECVTTIELV